MTKTTTAPLPEPEFPLLTSMEEFLFNAPLYAKYKYEKDYEGDLFGMLVGKSVVDGHCYYCQKEATFHRSNAGMEFNSYEHEIGYQQAHLLEIACTRNEDHSIVFILHMEQGLIEKIGQYPSLADIANDESRTYRKVLELDDSQELHKAIGLAAHGVGVGSFVYLRRVFERLINQHFQEFKGPEGWEDADFIGKRMDEKIELMQKYLPPFLVRNKKVYSILSKGIHELEEDECLSAFEMLKYAIFFILDEDKRKKEELLLRNKAEKAIATFTSNEV